MTSERDWAERTLCDDGACTGVIGGDGACRVCGRASRFWGDERRRGLQAPVDADEDGEDDAPADQGPGSGDDDRRLCVDGGCVGLIGDDNRCKVCGLPAAEPAPAKRAAKVASRLAAGATVRAARGGGAAVGGAAVGDEEDATGGGVDDGDDGDDDEEGEDDDVIEGDDVDGDGVRDIYAASAEGEGDDRKLCPDGACIGVIGSDGRCGVCGRSDAEN